MHILSCRAFRKTGVALLAALAVLPALPLRAEGVTGYTFTDELPADASALPAAPQKPWLHRRSAKKTAPSAGGVPLPAVLLPQVQALQAQVDALTLKLKQVNQTAPSLTAMKRQVTDLKQQLAGRDSTLAEMKQQLADRDGMVTDLKQQLATEKEARAEQTEELLALKRMTADVPLDTPEQKQAYASGVAFADMVTRSLQMQKSLGTEQPVDTVLAGITDAMKHRFRLNSEQIKTLNGKLYARLEARMKAQQAKAAQEKAAQEKAGADWYARYRKQAGVKELRPGVLYRVIRPGKGAPLKTDSTVDLLLTGTLSDGYLFDDSGLKGRVQRLKPEDILPALTDVLTTQRAGCHVEVLLSPSQAFGDEGVPGMIPGGATLKFDIQVQKKQPH
ncbi:FKBP-type peptidyl-prolyl cis-trans isomerase [Salmonella enterica]|nr:FKBP-type peptidyl-prolyl cis-trans isomerase [Salmonella enterica]EHM9142220.1 FKBP-type peptidyl-prolyl cis-trans isomerase [Salmonella enterica]EHM9207136.1 FKBP-type peptidyl-prolyl cis-trans isomerase [Salmonella enterica]EHM9295737.1 FKBP-type peptidyl-prolyl cis-trans isomerase [Salmonella enterica]EKO7832295.1 FKBP-type peptidyl-prolyl cis-trans isomerase [Salmonella enterica]